jgi:hypothetical protein
VGDRRRSEERGTFPKISYFSARLYLHRLRWWKDTLLLLVKCHAPIHVTLKKLLILPSQYSSVFYVILTRHYRFPTDTNIFSLLQTVLTNHDTHPGPCSVLTGAVFPCVNRHGTKNYSSHVAPRLRMSESTLPIPHMSSWYSHIHILLY